MDSFEPTQKQPRAATTIAKWTVVVVLAAFAIKGMTAIKQAQRSSLVPTSVWRFGTSDPELQSAIDNGGTEAIRRRLALIPRSAIRENFLTTMAAGNHIAAMEAALLNGWRAAGENGYNDPLFAAIELRSVDGVRTLLRHGADPNGPKRDGETPLLHALTYDRVFSVAPLLSGGRNPSPRPMLNIVDALLSNKADPNRSCTEPQRELGSNGHILFEPVTPLCQAAQTRNTAAIELLLDHGADPNSSSRAPAIVLAAGAGQAAHSIELLIQHGAKVDLAGSRVTMLGLEPYSVRATALYFAAENGDLEAVKALLVHGADPRRKASDGKTALEAARGDVYRYLRQRFGAHP